MQDDAFPNAQIGGCGWHKLRNVSDQLSAKGAAQDVSEQVQSALWKLVLHVCRHIIVQATFKKAWLEYSPHHS
jgi:hypothetical protein